MLLKQSSVVPQPHSFCLAQGTHRPASRCLEVIDGKCKGEMHVLNRRSAVSSTPLWSGCTTFSSLLSWVANQTLSDRSLWPLSSSTSWEILVPHPPHPSRVQTRMPRIIDTQYSESGCCEHHRIEAVLFFKEYLNIPWARRGKETPATSWKPQLEREEQIPLLMNTYISDCKDSLIIVFKANYKIIKAFLNITFPLT